MPVESTVIAKIGGGLIAAGSATTVGVVYKNDISKWFSNFYDEKQKTEDNFLFIVGSKNGITSTSDEDLYKTADGNTTKTKNYYCQFNSAEYECKIIKQITVTGDKKWISTKELFDDKVNKNEIDKTKFQTEHSLFLLKINTSKNFVLSDGNSFSILQKDNNDQKTKKFAELTPIFAKKNKSLINKASLFLGKIKDFGAENTSEYQIETNKTYKCGFVTSKTTPSNNDLKECSILKFVGDEQANASAEKQYTDLTFVSEEQKVTTSDKLKQHGYYIVKFEQSLETSKYLNKNLIYLEVSDTEPKKIINFSSTITSFTSSQADSKKLLLLVD